MGIGEAAFRRLDSGGSLQSVTEGVGGPVDCSNRWREKATGDAGNIPVQIECNFLQCEGHRCIPTGRTGCDQQYLKRWSQYHSEAT